MSAPPLSAYFPEALISMFHPILLFPDFRNILISFALLNLHTMSAALIRRIARATASRLSTPRVSLTPTVFDRGTSTVGPLRVGRRCLHCTQPSREAASATAIRKELSKAEKESYKGENIS